MKRKYSIVDKLTSRRVDKLFELLFIVLLLLPFKAIAQDVNKLVVGNISGMRSTDVNLPISMENTNPNIVAMQFNVVVPEGVTLSMATNDFTLEQTRCVNHRARGSACGGNEYRVMLLSPNNTPLKANRGNVFSIKASLASDALLNEGESYPIVVNNVVLSDSLGNNVMTEFENGSLTISPNPDFMVSNVAMTTASPVNPNDKIDISWTVNNIGSVPSLGGWSEQISLVSTTTGETTSLGSMYYSETLGSGASVSRQGEFTIPRIVGLDGSFKIQVKLIPNSDSGERSEYQTNNTTQSASAYELNKILYLSIPTGILTETNGTRNYTAYLERSGSRAYAQTFSISKERGDGRMSAPASVTINKNNSSVYFSLTAVGDSELNTDSIFTFRVQTANGYEQIEGSVQMEDDEHPQLTLTSSVEELTEGDKFMLTITSSIVAEKDLKVKLSNSKPERFVMPSSVTIPQGSTSATVEVEAYDDVDVQDVVSVNFSATAYRYDNGRCSVFLNDNDMPDLEWTLTPTTVSESAGPSAIMVVLKRKNRTGSRVTIKLSDNGNGDIYYSTKTITLQKGQTEAQFSIGVVDNSEKEGDRDILLSAAIYISSCSCSAGKLTGGYVEQPITILDDDGPALTLSASSSNMLEGSTNNTFTITRNDTPTNALVVELCSTADDDVVYPQTVTIPAGSKSTTFVVEMKRNDVQGDSKTIVFTAMADNYAKGTCWVQSTDQTLPDASISDLSVNTAQPFAGNEVLVTAVVQNTGYSILPAQTRISLIFNGKELETSLFTQSEIAPGGSESVTKAVILSDIAGTFPLIASVNRNSDVTELNYGNNSSKELRLTFLPRFTATAVTNKQVYNNSEVVIISGQASGMEFRNADVEIYIISGGTRLTVQAKTDDEGKYSAEWQPSGNQAGHFSIGACSVGENLNTEMTSIDIYGLRRYTSGFLTNEFEVNETKQGYIDLYNHGSLALNNVQVEIDNLPDNVNVSFTSISQLNPGENARIIATFTGLSETEGKDWQTFVARFKSSEGAELEQTIYYFVHPNVAKLVASTTQINTTMIKGATRSYEITLTNEGRKETGEIVVDLGGVEWLSTATPIRMASLAPNEETTVVLQLTPSSSMDLNSIQTGNIYISAANNTAVSINYRLETVSDQTGTLQVDVWDEFTLNTPEAPHVSGATVTVLHPVTQRLLRQDVTGENGIVTFENLNEGKYLLKVTHPKHNSYSGTVIVSPARVTKERAFIEYSAVSVTMTYEETEVEDEYEIVTTVTYETNVPKAVIKMDVPDKILLDEIQTPYMFYVNLTNVGLIAAIQTRLSFNEETNGYKFTPLIEGPWTILPQQMITVPIQITKIESEDTSSSVSQQQGPMRIGPTDLCAWGIMASFFSNCEAILNGSFNPSSEQSISNQIQLRNSCGLGELGAIADILSQLGFGGGGPGGPTFGTNPIGGGGGGSSFSGNGSVSCDPCLTKNGQDYINCLQNMGGDKVEKAQGAKCLLKPCPDSGSSVSAHRSLRIYGNLPARVYSNEFQEKMQEVMDSLHFSYEQIYTSNNDLHYFEDPLVMPGTDLGQVVEQRVPEELPSWMSAFNDKAYVAYYENYHNLLYQYHILGDWSIAPTTMQVLQVLIDAANLAHKNGQDITVEGLSDYRPDNITDEQFANIVQRINNGYTATGDYVDFEFLNSCQTRCIDAEMQAQRMGYSTCEELLQKQVAILEEYLTKGRNSVCSTVKLQIEQKLTMTRQAVRGTLTVINGSELQDMTNITLNLVVTDPYGNVADSHIMEIHTEDLNGFTGELDYESGWSLAAGKTGVAHIIFIPTKYAAPTEPLQYTFAGSITFTDPFTGLTMTRELETERLTVKPSPNLELIYFMQRDILGDDPLTEDVVENIVPSQFSLLINNKGYGDATNVKMLTQQPKIIENERGLFITFEILSSQLNGADKTLAMGSSVTTDFGTIKAHSQAYAQWWMTSTLTGHFVDYDVQATHVTSYDNPDLTLLDTVHIHELIHEVKIPLHEETSPRLIGFMANDEEDDFDYPDILYLSDGTTQPIVRAEYSKISKKSDTVYELEVGSSAQGWNYGNLPDPTGGTRKLVSILRQSDGAEIYVENFWQTDRTLVDGQEPVYENLLHFADSMRIEGEKYTLIFTDRPNVVLEVKSFSGIPQNNSYTRDNICTVVVTFNKGIEESSFTTDDLTFRCQGELLDASQVIIEKVNDNTYNLNVEALTTLDGYYTLTVQCSGITDMENFNGETGKQAAWIQVKDGKATLTMKVYPENAGVVTPETGIHDYECDVEVSAIPNEGYSFNRWEQDGQALSTDATYTYNMFGAKTLTAVFQPKFYNVTIDYDPLAGVVSGGGSGLLEYNQTLNLKARPNTGYYFVGWYKNGSLISEEQAFDLTIQGTADYEARFLPMNSVSVMLDEDDVNEGKVTSTRSQALTVKMNRVLTPFQWNTFCVPMDISEQQINKQWGYYSSLLELTSVTNDVLNFTPVYCIRAGHIYLVRPERKVLVPEFTYNGDIVVEDNPVPSDFGEYSFVGIYSPREWENIGTEYYYGVSSNTLYPAKTTTATLKGMRGYFVIPAGRRAMINLDGQLTEIINIVQDRIEDGKIYNLQGLLVGTDWNKLPQGIYIVNGQKRIKK